jgi:hypothetical protein
VHDEPDLVVSGQNAAPDEEMMKEVNIDDYCAGCFDFMLLSGNPPTVCRWRKRSRSKPQKWTPRHSSQR